MKIICFKCVLGARTPEKLTKLYIYEERRYKTLKNELCELKNTLEKIADVSDMSLQGLQKLKLGGK